MTLTTLSKVRLAQPADEPEILHLFHLMHAEGGMRKLSIERVRETLARAFERRGGICAVIGNPGQIRAMMYLLISRYYYTEDNHIEELWNWVHPQHRHADYAKLMIEYAKDCSDKIGQSMGEKVPLLMGVLTNHRMAAKVRLYRRYFGIPAGAFFVHNPTWVCVQEPCEEDFWKIPKLAKRLRRRSFRETRQGLNGA